MGDLFGGGSRKTKVAPTSTAQPYLQQGLDEAKRLYQMPKPVVPFSQDSTQAQQMVRDRVSGGDPTIDAASKYVRDSLDGNFLNSNPYLDKTFDMAAQRSQGQLASQFAGVGRNVSGTQGLRSQQLGDLATQIYGGAYENDRNRQQGTLSYAQDLGNQKYTDAGALSAVGAQQEAKQQEQIDAPYKGLDDYLARIGKVDTGSETTETVKADPLTTIAGGLTAASGLFGSGLNPVDIKDTLAKYGNAGSDAIGAAAGGLDYLDIGDTMAKFGGDLSPVDISGTLSKYGGAGASALAGASGLGAFGGLAPVNIGSTLATYGGAGQAAIAAAGGAPAATGAAATGAAAGGGGFGSAALAAAPWVAAAIGVGAVVANNLPKSSPLDGFNASSLSWDKAQNFDNTKFQPQELNTFFGPAIQVFAQTGDAEKALAAIPKPTNAREEIMLKGGTKALFGGTGNPFRQIAKAKGYGEGIWTAGNAGKAAATKAASTGVFGSPNMGFITPTAPRMVA